MKVSRTPDDMRKYPESAGKSRRHKAAVISRTTERGLNFVVVRKPTFREGKLLKWPALYLIRPNAKGDDIEVIRCGTLDDYFDTNHSRSQQWRRDTCEALGLLVDHTVATLRFLTPAQLASPGLPRTLFRNFAIALAEGTSIHTNGKTLDLTGLFWIGKGGRRAKWLLLRLTDFIRSLEPGEWAWDSREFGLLKTDKIDAVTSFRASIALAIKRKKSLLAHLPSDSAKARAPTAATVKSSGQSKRAHSFPSEWVFPFVMEGFTNRNGDTDETAQLLALLLFAGGPRKSEPLHCFVSDVQFIQKEPWIFMHNPQSGKVIDAYENTITRAEYLRKFKMSPRNINEEAEHSGWKSVAEDDIGTPLFWLPVMGIKDLLYTKLRHYLLVTRPGIMKQRPQRFGDHPFLFVGSGRTASSNGRPIGSPYTISAFNEAWKAAVNRIARKHNVVLEYGKIHGTTPHGARHYYGRFLTTLNVPGDIIQDCMHHKHPDSHKVYTRLSPTEINKVLRTASDQRGNASTSQLSDEFQERYHGMKEGRFFLAGVR